jgi:signal transduction histidine kinase
VLYVGLAVIAGVRWATRGAAVRGWVFATFGVLAAIVLAGQLLPDDPTGAWLWALKAVVAGIALFPYCLHRFAETFEPSPRAWRLASAALTVAAGGGVFLFPRLPDADEPRSPAFQLYALLILLQWLFLVGQVSVRLWRGGRGRATIARRRMRTLSLGAALLAVALAIALFAPSSSPDEAGAMQLVTSVLALVAAPLFLLGVAPPSLLLASWRRADEHAMRNAEAQLMGASNEEDVANALLPLIAHALAARSAALLDGDGRVVVAHGEPMSLPPADGVPRRGHLSLPLTSGQVVVEADADTPYIGREETEVLRELAALTDVALRRARVTQRERKVAGELAQANEAMREFVAIASHDLRTPISLVRGYASLMLASWESMADEEKRQHVAAIERQGSHLSRLVDDLLTISRLDAKAMQPDVRAVPLTATLEEIIRDLGREDDTTCDVPADVTVCVDPEHFGRMIRNLIENAFAYGEPPVEITAAVSDSDVTIRFRDHGQGVAAEFLPRLFDRFTRADTVKTREARGTGLGLSIVRGLATANGGDVTYERPSTGPGACFVLRLPRESVTGE